MIRRTLVIIALATTLFAAQAPTAHAVPYAGACLVNITFHFDEVVRLLTIDRTYSVDMNGNCPFITFGGTTTHDTFAEGFGRSFMWNCEMTASEGTWDQWWVPGPPDNAVGGFTMAGSFAGWDMVINGQGFVAHGRLELASDHLGAPLECEGDGLWELRMTGVLEFQQNA